MIFNAWKSLSDGLSLCSANRVVVQSHHPGPDCLRELDSLALWLKEPTGQNTLILEVSSFRHFCAKHRDFLPGNFCTLCRILQVRVPIVSLETVQKQCRNRALTLGQIKNDDFWSMTWWRFEWPQRYIWYIGRRMPTRLRSSQGSGHFCIMAFCICHLPLLA